MGHACLQIGVHCSGHQAGHGCHSPVRHRDEIALARARRRGEYYETQIHSMPHRSDLVFRLLYARACGAGRPGRMESDL